MKKSNFRPADSFSLLILIFGIFFSVYRLSSIYGNFPAGEPVRVVWDMAHYGYRGVRISEDWRELNLPFLFKDTISQKLHPFIHSYILSVFFLIWGTTVEAASRASLAAFIGCALLIFFLGREVTEKWKNFCGLSAFFLLITSPTYLVFSTLIMLEIWSALFTLAGLLLFIKAVGDDSKKLYLLSYLTTTVLFFTKYNYGIYLMVTIFAVEALRLSATSRRFIGREITSYFRFKNLFAFSNVALLLIIFSLSAVIFTGGFTAELFGVEVSFQHLRNPLYLLALLLIFKAVRYCRSKWKALAGNFLPRHAALVIIIVIPVLIWFLMPDSLEAFISFARARPADVQRQGIKTLSLDNVAYYPKIILGYYCISKPIFIFIAVLYFLSLFNLKRENRAVKIMQLYFFISFGLMLLHPYKEVRFIFVVLCPLWVIAAAKAASLLSHRRWKKFCIPLVICLLIAHSPKIYSRLSNFYQHRLFPRARRWFQPSPDLTPVIESIISETTTADKVIVQGTFNEISPDLLRWNIFNAGYASNKRIVFDLNEEDILRVLRDSEVKKIVLIKVYPDSPYYSPDYVSYNSWKTKAMRTLENDRMFVFERAKYFKSVGVEVKVAVRKTPAG